MSELKLTVYTKGQYHVWKNKKCVYVFPIVTEGYLMYGLCSSAPETNSKRKLYRPAQNLYVRNLMRGTVLFNLCYLKIILQLHNLSHEKEPIIYVILTWL